MLAESLPTSVNVSAQWVYDAQEVGSPAWSVA